MDTSRKEQTEELRRDEDSRSNAERSDGDRHATRGDLSARPSMRNGADEGDRAQTLLPQERLGGFRSRWTEVQTGFVDDPRSAVRKAEALVNDIVNELSTVFTRERESLEEVWNRGDEASTEDMRIALQRYRSFFERLLAA